MSPWVALALFLAVASAPLWERWHRKRDARIAKRKACRHINMGVPVFDFGEYWHRHCLDCGGQQNGRKDAHGQIHWSDFYL